MKNNFLVFIICFILSFISGSCEIPSKKINTSEHTQVIEKGKDTISKIEKYEEPSSIEKMVCKSLQNSKVCYYKNFKFELNNNIQTIYKKDSSGNYVKISLIDMFNNNRKELLGRINKYIKVIFTERSTNQETKDCFKGKFFISFVYNQLDIRCKEDGLEFISKFNLPENCKSVANFSVFFSLDELLKYFSE